MSAPDKRDDHGDGDRETLRAAPTVDSAVALDVAILEMPGPVPDVVVGTVQEAVDELSEDDKMGVNVQADEGQAAADRADMMLELPVSHEVEQQPTEDAPQTVPGGFPMSALQSPVGEASRERSEKDSTVYQQSMTADAFHETSQHSNVETWASSDIGEDEEERSGRPEQTDDPEQLVMAQVDQSPIEPLAEDEHGLSTVEAIPSYDAGESPLATETGVEAENTFVLYAASPYNYLATAAGEIHEVTVEDTHREDAGRPMAVHETSLLNGPRQDSFRDDGIFQFDDEQPQYQKPQQDEPQQPLDGDQNPEPADALQPASPESALVEAKPAHRMEQHGGALPPDGPLDAWHVQPEPYVTDQVFQAHGYGAPALDTAYYSRDIAHETASETIPVSAYDESSVAQQPVAWYEHDAVVHDPYQYTAPEHANYESSYYASAQQSLVQSPDFAGANEQTETHEEVPQHQATHAPQGLALDKELDLAEHGGEQPEAHVEEHEDVYDAAAENSVTVHGQDDLFDSDGDEAEFEAGDSDAEYESTDEMDAADSELHEESHEASADAYEVHDTHDTHDAHNAHDAYDAHDAPADVPETPTTIVAGHDLEEEVPQMTAERPEAPPSSAATLQFKGLSNSRHAPQPDMDMLEQAAPVTPPRQTTDAPLHDDDFSAEEGFMPRDVTNIPWDERAVDATPGSVRSQTTLSVSSLSNSPSPWHAVTPQHHSGNAPHGRIAGDSHQDDPFIRNSWSSMPDSDHPGAAGQDSIILDRSKVMTTLDFDDGGHRSPVAAPPQSSLFHRMRSIFEPPSGSDGAVEVHSIITPPKAIPAARAVVTLPITRGPYPATSSVSNKLVEEGFIRGVAKPVRANADAHADIDADEDDSITERSALLQAAVIGSPSY